MSYKFFVIWNVLFVIGLFGGMLALQYVGRQLGERDNRLQPGVKGTPGATEGAVYGLLGLFLAFTFSGAGSRFESRFHLMVEEANAISTAWLRIDVLPAGAQPHMRDLFRQYADSRLALFRVEPTAGAIEAIQRQSTALQREIWDSAIAAAKDSTQTTPSIVFLPALNAMFDMKTAHDNSVYLHPPTGVFIMVAILALVGSLLAGYGMAGTTRTLIHRLGFALVLTMAVFVIVDLEYPRLGLIRSDAADRVLVDVRNAMN